MNSLITLLTPYLYPSPLTKKLIKKLSNRKDNDSIHSLLNLTFPNQSNPLIFLSFILETVEIFCEQERKIDEIRSKYSENVRNFLRCHPQEITSVYATSIKFTPVYSKYVEDEIMFVLVYVSKAFSGIKKQLEKLSVTDFELLTDQKTTFNELPSAVEFYFDFSILNCIINRIRNLTNRQNQILVDSLNCKEFKGQKQVFRLKRSQICEFLVFLRGREIGDVDIGGDVDEVVKDLQDEIFVFWEQFSKQEKVDQM